MPDAVVKSLQFLFPLNCFHARCSSKKLPLFGFRSGDLESQSSAIAEFEVKRCEEKGGEGVFLEHVEVVVTLEHSLRGALEVTLTSARGNWEPLGSISLPTTERPSKHSEVENNCSQFLNFPDFYFFPFISE